MTIELQVSSPETKSWCAKSHMRTDVVMQLSLPCFPTCFLPTLPDWFINLLWVVDSNSWHTKNSFLQDPPDIHIITYQCYGSTPNSATQTADKRRARSQLQLWSDGCKPRASDEIFSGALAHWLWFFHTAPLNVSGSGGPTTPRFLTLHRSVCQVVVVGKFRK